MNVVVCHNYYRERGGEDQVFEDEVSLLEANGHQVTQFIRRNSDFSGFGTLKAAAGAAWNRGVVDELTDVVRQADADIVHFHNWLPQISPAGFYAAHKGGAAVVQTLHNYRWACPKGTFFRDGKVCEDCLGKSVPWPSVVHACYRNSPIGSAVVATALAIHNTMNTPERAIDAFIAPSQFLADKLTSAGLPGDRIYIKPLLVSPDPGPGTGSGGFAMYLGRLSPEKKIDTLLAAWNRLNGSVPLKISGSGPLAQTVEAAARENPAIEYLGFASTSDVIRLLGEARLLVFPSGTYEAQPKTILESFARGTPAVVGRMGSMEGLVEDGVTGWHFKPSDPIDLADTVARAFSDARLESMRQAARKDYLDNYSPEGNYEQLVDIYRRAIERRRQAKEHDQ